MGASRESPKSERIMTKSVSTGLSTKCMAGAILVVG